MNIIKRQVLNLYLFNYSKCKPKLFFKIQYKFSKDPKKVPTIDEVKQHWSQYSSQYSSFDYSPQTFFYTLAYMMQIHKANKILEVACGTGKLLPIILQMKKQQAQYYAMDLSPQMIKLAEKNMKMYFNKFQSNISYQEWIIKQNMIIKQGNGQQLQKSDYDRLICNCCLMLTENPQKMLKSLNKAAKTGGLLGLSIWGDRQKNNYLNAIKQSILQTGNQLINERTAFHLYGKVQKLLQKTGWQIILNWQQNTLFPVLQLNLEQQAGLLFHHIERLPQSYREQVRVKFIEKIKKIMNSKVGLHFNCQLIIARKINDIK